MSRALDLPPLNLARPTPSTIHISVLQHGEQPERNMQHGYDVGE